jgi:hypothetical protein
MVADELDFAMKEGANTHYVRDSQSSASMFIFVLLMLFILLSLFGGGNGTLRDADTYWHVAVGRLIWQTASVPHIDEMSHTFQGHTWIANDWLIELLMYGAYSLGGWRAVVLLTDCTLAATYALLYLVLARKLRLTVAVGTAAVAYVFSLVHFLARPHIFAFPLAIVWFAGLVRSVENKTAPTFLLLPVMVIWANIHGSFTLGIAFAGAFAAEALLDSEKEDRLRTAIRWGIFLIAAVLTACATPYGYGPMLLTLKVFYGNSALQMINEWLPMFSHPNLINPLIVFILLFLALYYGAKIPFWRLLIVLALGYGMLSHIRLAPLFAIITPIVLMGPLSQQFPFLGLATEVETNPKTFVLVTSVSKRLLYPTCALLVFAIMAFGLFGPLLSPRQDITPASGVDYMLAHNLNGNCYNDFEFGGYLVFRGIKTFIDGRTDQLFSGKFMDDLQRLRSQPTSFASLLQKYDVSVALVKPQSIEAGELDRSARWRKVYGDDISLLYVMN